MPPADVDKLRRLVTHLRSAEGCPWDREQTLEDVRAYLLEEAHEAAAAMDGGDPKELSAELGDVIFQVVFAARLAEEAGAFTLGDVIDGVHAKMVARHPHVFGDEDLADAAAVHRAWERRKVARGDRASVLGGIPATLPALTGALRVSQKAAGVGFDWPDAEAVPAKVREEVDEIAEAADAGDRPRCREEIGDLLFAVASLARHLRIDPEAALAAATIKFRRRFEAVEASLTERGASVAEASMDEMQSAWDDVKRSESGDSL